MILASSEDAMPAGSATDATTTIRRFNRFYTAKVGALGVGFLGTPYTLTEARLLYELGHEGLATAASISQRLETDPAQISRTVARMERAGLVARARDDRDGRRQRLSLTTRGRREFRRLDRLSRERAEALMAPLDADRRARLLGAMRTIEGIMSDGTGAAPTVMIRPHRPGDLGWVVSRHGSLYAEEYGWDASFEALVAGVAKDFLDRFDPAREACWIAEVDGRRVGSVCLVKKSRTIAKLRLLIVDPSARGLGIGTRLVAECVRFARRVGYRKITLWTNSILDAARRIYENAGFVRTSVGPVERRFGKELVFETWDLDLAQPRR
jgi:DNA-binding MarR family transcriptional regulator/GNAT superfamily N-acetyltransferase